MRAIVGLFTAGVLSAAVGTHGASWSAQIVEAKRLRDEGRTAQAARLYREVLESARQADLRDPNAAENLNNVGVQFFEMARYAEAETLYRLALKAWPAGADRDAALTLGNLGTLLRTMGRYSEAEPA